MLGINPIWFWLVALIAFCVIEGCTAGLVSIWFAAGSLAALIGAALGAPWWLQAVLFLIVSAVTLAATRPLAKKYISGRRERTNADRVLEQTGVVIERIDNIAGTGAVKVGAAEWTARSRGGETIEEGALVRAESIDGVKLIVTPAAQKEKTGMEV